MKNPAISSIESSGAAVPPAVVSLVPVPAPVKDGAESTPDNRLDVQLRQVKTRVTKRIKKRAGETDTEIWDVRVGSALLTVYFTPSGERKLFTVSYMVDGKRKRQVKSSLDLAIEEAKSVGKQLARGDFGTIELTAAQRVAADRALTILKPIGVPLELAASEYASAVTRLGKVSLSQAVDYYLKRHPANQVPMKVQKVIDEMLLLKQNDGLSDGYLRHLGYDLEKFATAFHGNIEAVAGLEIDKWLRGLGVSPRTRNNLRRSVQSLFNFAISRKYLPKDHDEMDAVPQVKDGGGEIVIFTPKEMTEILKHADERVIPFLTLGAFAGIRHAEIQRLEWNDLKFDAGIIEIRAAKAKTASRRTVPILDNLRVWLSKKRKEAGPVCVYLNMASEIESLVRAINAARRAVWAKKNRVSAKALKAADERAAARRTEERKKTGKRKRGTIAAPGAETAAEEGWVPFAWKHNALRHSFISYRVAETQDVAKVSLEAGNSPQMIFKHYRELVQPKEAKAWFAIAPDGGKG